MAKSPKFKSLWPCPVYVATFADGTTQRMSFASPASKPLDFERGRRLLAWACAQEQPVYEPVEAYGRVTYEPRHADGRTWNTGASFGLAEPRTDMIAGFVDYDGQRHDDPFFAPSNVVPMAPKKRASKAAADLEKAVAIIAALEAQFGACFPAECAEAMEFLLNREAA